MASENDMKKMFASPIVEYIFEDTINAEETLPVESKRMKSREVMVINL